MFECVVNSVVICLFLIFWYYSYDLFGVILICYFVYFSLSFICSFVSCWFWVCLVLFVSLWLFLGLERCSKVCCMCWLVVVVVLISVCGCRRLGCFGLICFKLVLTLCFLGWCIYWCVWCVWRCTVVWIGLMVAGLFVLFVLNICFLCLRLRWRFVGVVVD